MISITTPTTAIEIVRHMAAGGRCIIRVIPQKYMTVTYPREVEQVRQDSKGEWWFGVTLWAFQWFQFPAVGLEWTLVSNECETPSRWPAAADGPTGSTYCEGARGACETASIGPEDGSKRCNCQDAAGGQTSSV